jgi:UDP-N-acetylmuramoyl-L-alanyl-D-glutamate--2,6-diaminopimelate ligase
LAGRKAGFVSTVQRDLGSGATDNPEHQTTPEASILQAQMHEMAQASCEFAVIESLIARPFALTNRLADVLSTPPSSRT